MVHLLQVKKKYFEEGVWGNLSVKPNSGLVLGWRCESELRWKPRGIVGFLICMIDKWVSRHQAWSRSSRLNNRLPETN